MRVALWNASGLPNIGDKIIDHVTRRELSTRIDKIRLTTFTPWPSEEGQEQLIIDCNGIWNGHGQYDAIVIGGGALITGPPFLDFGSPFFQFGPYPERFRDPAPVAWNAVCSDRQFAAPLRDSWKAFVQQATNRVNFRTVRNPQTRSFLKCCGAQGDITIVPEVGVLATGPRRPRASRTGRLRIGVAIGQPVFPDEFTTWMARAQANLSANINPDVMAFEQTCTSWDESGFVRRFAAATGRIARTCDMVFLGFGEMYGDVALAKTLAGTVDGATFRDISMCNNLELVEVFSDLDLLVASRLHACVLAFASALPFLAVDIYSESGCTTKLREFMGQIGLAHRYSSINDAVDGTKLADAVESGSRDDHVQLCEIHARTALHASLHFDSLAGFLMGEAGRG